MKEKEKQMNLNDIGSLCKVVIKNSTTNLKMKITNKFPATYMYDNIKYQSRWKHTFWHFFEQNKYRYAHMNVV